MAIYNPVLPYVGPIGGTLLPGRSVRIHGTVHPGATRFAINLQSGPNLYPRDDVAVHISADFIRNCIVRNNILNMNWGPEECHGHFPLARGQPFDITIHCERDCYKIHINGSHYTDFIHRIPYERVSYFSVDGDVTVNSIEYSGGHGYGHGHSGGHMPMPIPVPMVYPGAPGHVPLPPPGPHGYYPPPHDYRGAPAPYPTQPGNPYPTQPGVPYPTQPGVPYPTQAGANYPTQPGAPYPTQPGVPHSPYTEPYKKPSVLNKAGALIAGTAVGSAVLGGNHHHHGHHHHGHHGHHGHRGYHHGHHGKHHHGGPGMLGMAALGTGAAGAHFAGNHCNKKLLKSQKKAHKKALKYGLPIAGIAGAGVGAYALHKGFHHHGHHHSSSSSSSSSSSEEE